MLQNMEQAMDMTCFLSISETANWPGDFGDGFYTMGL